VWKSADETLHAGQPGKFGREAFCIAPWMMACLACMTAMDAVMKAVGAEQLEELLNEGPISSRWLGAGACGSVFLVKWFCFLSKRWVYRAVKRVVIEWTKGLKQENAVRVLRELELGVQLGLIDGTPKS
jgi:hypothetical protein